MPEQISEPLKNELWKLHSSDLPDHIKVIVAPIVAIGGGRITYKRSLEIAIPQFFQMLAHPSKTIKTLHEAYSIEMDSMTDEQIHSIADKAEVCPSK